MGEGGWQDEDDGSIDLRALATGTSSTPLRAEAAAPGATGSAHQPAPLCPRPAPTHRQAGRVDSPVVASVVGCRVKWRVAPPSCDEAETQLRVGPRARKPDSRR